MLEFKDMTNNMKEELEAVIKAHRDESLSFMNAYISGEAREAWDYYYGQLPRPVSNGTSRYTDRTVWETVNGSLQDMLNVFCSGEDAVSFVPASDDEPMELTESATQLVNQVFLRDNDGYSILSDALKECLVTRAGFIKRYWDTSTEIATESFEDINPIELAAYVKGLEAAGMKGVDLKINESEDNRGTVSGEITYHAEIEGVKFEYVPVEQILVNSKAKSVKDAIYFAQRRMISKEDLLEMGASLDLINSISDWIIGDDSNMETTTWSRSDYRVDLDNTDGFYDNDRAQRCWVYEHYVRTSVLDPLGRTRLYQVFEAHNEVFEVIEVDEIPFSFFTPYPIPGCMFGESVWDITRDLQDLRTALYRGVIDNINNANFGQYTAIKGQYDRRSLLNQRPGGVVEINQPNAVQLFPYHQLPAATMDMINMTDDMKEERTGVTKLGMGIDPEVFKNDNAYATVGIMMNAAQNRLRMICRNIANNGMTELFRSTYRLIRQNGKLPIKVLTPNGYTYVDPKSLPARDEVIVNVAISAGEKNERAQNLSQIHNMLVNDPAIAPLYGMTQQRFMMSQIMNLMGVKDVDNYLLPMNQYKPAPPPLESIINLKQLEAQVQNTEAETKKIYADIIQNQEKLEYEQEKAADQTQLDNMQMQLDQEKAADETINKHNELISKNALEQSKHRLELLKMQWEKENAIMDALLEQEKIDAQRESAKQTAKSAK